MAIDPANTSEDPAEDPTPPVTPEDYVPADEDLIHCPGRKIIPAEVWKGVGTARAAHQKARAYLLSQGLAADDNIVVNELYELPERFLKPYDRDVMEPRG